MEFGTPGLADQTGTALALDYLAEGEELERVVPYAEVALSEGFVSIDAWRTVHARPTRRRWSA